MYVKSIADEFAREYYTRVHSTPSSLYQLYASDASVIHANEGSDSTSNPTEGEEEVQNLLNREGFGHSKVYITDITALRISSSFISVVVIGDMKSGDEQPPKIFTQSFGLYYDPQNGPLIVTDILKYLQEEETPRLPSDNHEDNRIGATNSKESDPDQSASLESSDANQENLRADATPTAPSVSSTSSSTSTPTPTSSSAQSSSSGEVEPIEKEESDESGKPSGPYPSDENEKPKKFKFSFDTIAKAPSFRPKGAVPNYPMTYSMGGYSPTYSPTPAYQTAIPPHHLHLQQVPFQYQMPPQFVPQLQGPQPMLSGKAYLDLSSDQVTSEQVARTLDSLASFRNYKLDPSRKRGFVDFIAPETLMHLSARGPIHIAGTNATLIVKPLRPGQRRGDSHVDF